MDYLSDFSGLKEINKNYTQKSYLNPWSTEAKPEGALDKWLLGKQSEPTNLTYTKNPYYAPVEAYPTMKYLNKKFPELSYSPTGGVTYNRTGRNLGTVPLYNEGYSVSPIHADYFIDIAKELDRVDPNVMYYNFRNITPQTDPNYNGQYRYTGTVK